MHTVDVAGAEVRSLDPAQDPPWPAVVVLHEATGLNRDIARIAAHLAGLGYAVAAPDLYSGGLRPVCIARTVREAFVAPSRTATTDRIEQVRGWLAGRAEVDEDRIGVIGFCMGGGFAVVAAARSPFAAAAVNYGRVPQDTSLLAGSCPVIANYGGQDRWIPKGTPERYAAALREQGVPIDVEVFPGVGHSFMNHEPRVMGAVGIRFDGPTAERAWARIERFLAEHLGGAHGSDAADTDTA